MASDTVVSKVDGICQIINHAGSRMLCFTRTSHDGKLKIGLSDGVRVWQILLSAGDAGEYELLRLLLTADGDIKVSTAGGVANVTLRSTKGDKSLSYDMRLLDSLESQVEISYLLFLTAQRALDLEKELDQAGKKIESLRQSVTAATSNANSSVFDLSFDTKKKKVQQKAPQQKGMSVINPGCKKRSKAHGVEFD